MDKKELEAEFLRRFAEAWGEEMAAQRLGLVETEEERAQVKEKMLWRLKQAVEDAEKRGLLVEGVEVVIDGPLHVVSGLGKVSE